MEETTKVMEEKKEIGIELRPDIGQGIYSNLAIILHSHSEFMIDFAAMLPGMQKAVVNSRIIMTPENAKNLLRALQDNVQKFEAKFGPIENGGGQKSQGGTFNLGDLTQFGNGGTKS